MITAKVVNATPLLPKRLGYFNVFLGALTPEQAEQAKKALSRPRLAHALNTESKFGFWCDNDISAANFLVGFRTPAVSLRRFEVTDQGLSALLKPVGKHAAQLRERLAAGTPVTIQVFFDSESLELFVSEWEDL